MTTSAPRSRGFRSAFPIQIDVTADDIANGIRDSCNRCPVVRAMTRALAPFGISEIAALSDAWDAWFRDPKNNNELTCVSGRFPQQVTQRIRTYDRGGPMAPFSFTLSHGA